MSSPEPSPDTPQGASAAPDQTVVAQDQAAAAATQQNQVRSLASALTPTDPTVYAEVVKGTLTAFTTSTLPPMCSVQLQGDTSTTIDNVRFIDSYMPVVGDTVLIVKQGSELFVLGQMTENKTASQSGWQTASLSTTWNNSTGAVPVLYRKVFDNGSWKVQLQGRAIRNGSNTGTTVFTLPSGFTPAVVRNVAAARENLTGGDNTIQVQINTSGNVDISGATLNMNVSATTNAVQHGNLTTSYYNVDHYHIGPFGNLGGSGGDSAVKCNPGFGEIAGVLGGSAQDGGTSATHRHTTDSATHSHTVTVSSTLTFPGWVSLDGIEFFL